MLATECDLRMLLKSLDIRQFPARITFRNFPSVTRQIPIGWFRVENRRRLDLAPFYWLFRIGVSHVFIGWTAESSLSSTTAAFYLYKTTQFLASFDHRRLSRDERFLSCPLVVDLRDLCEAVPWSMCIQYTHRYIQCRVSWSMQGQMPDWRRMRSCDLKRGTPNLPNLFLLWIAYGFHSMSLLRHHQKRRLWTWIV